MFRKLQMFTITQQHKCFKYAKAPKSFTDDGKNNK